MERVTGFEPANVGVEGQPFPRTTRMFIAQRSPIPSPLAPSINLERARGVEPL